MKTTRAVPRMGAVYLSCHLRFFRSTSKLKFEPLGQETQRYSRIMHTRTKRLMADVIGPPSTYLRVSRL